MTEILLPPGTQAYLLGSSASLADMNIYAPLEENSPEGTLMLMRLDFGELPQPEILAELEAVLSDTGVSPWLGQGYTVFASETEPSVYLCWTKEFAWLPIIIGAVGGIILPPLLGVGLWMIIPSSVKNMIEDTISLVMMALVMFLMAKMMPSFSSRKEKKREIEEGSEE